MLTPLVIAAVVVGVPTPLVSCPAADTRKPWPPILQEYQKFVSDVGARVHPIETRHRRDAAPPPPPRYYGIGSLTIVGDLDYYDRRAIKAAYQYLSMLYTIDPDAATPVDIEVRTNSPPPEESPSVIGSWNGVYIDLYVSRISNPDMLFTVTLHEMFHAIAFTGIDFGNGAFTSKSDAETYQYNGPVVNDIIAPHNATTDTTRTHWANNVGVFAFDVMEPVLDADKIALSRGTCGAVIDCRGDSWLLMACTQTEGHCPDNHTCVGQQDHLPGYCLRTGDILKVPKPAPSRVNQFPAISAFIFGAFLALTVLGQCAQRSIRSPASSAIMSLRRKKGQ